MAKDVGVETQGALEYIEPAVEQNGTLVGAAKVLEDVLVCVNGE